MLTYTLVQLLNTVTVLKGERALGGSQSEKKRGLHFQALCYSPFKALVDESMKKAL